MLADTAGRVPEQTSEEINRRIREQIRSNVMLYGCCNSEMIDQRLRELDEEWDIERALQLNASALATLLVASGLFGRKRWLLLAGAVTGFLAQHAWQGWCPPVKLLRRLGFRTRREIDEERYALKVLRGDFEGLAADGNPTSPEQTDAALSAVQR